MAWIAVHRTVVGPKLRKLCKQIDCNKSEAVGILCFLWFWGQENSDKDGRLIEADESDIEDALAGITNIPMGVLVDALISTGWIDKRDDGCLYLHDWDTWQEQWYKAMERRDHDTERKRKARANKKIGKEIAGGKKLDDPQDNPLDTPQDPPQNPPEPPNPPEEPKKPDSGKYSNAFETFWEEYPRKEGKAEAYKKYMARRKDGWSDEELLRAAKNYAYVCRKHKTEKEYIKHAKTFLSENTPFVDFIPKNTAPKAATVPNMTNPFAEYEEE